MENLFLCQPRLAFLFIKYDSNAKNMLGINTQHVFGIAID